MLSWRPLSFPLVLSFHGPRKEVGAPRPPLLPLSPCLPGRAGCKAYLVPSCPNPGVSRRRVCPQHEKDGESAPNPHKKIKNKRSAAAVNKAKSTGLGGAVCPPLLGLVLPAAPSRFPGPAAPRPRAPPFNRIWEKGRINHGSSFTVPEERRAAARHTPAGDKNRR